MDIATIALGLSIFNTALIFIIINKFKLQINTADILTALTIVREAMSVIKAKGANPDSERRVDELLASLEKLLTKYNNKKNNTKA